MSTRPSAVAVLLSCLPRNGMAWPQHGHRNITPRHRVDARVVAALRSLSVPLRKRDVQVALNDLVNDATVLAPRVVSLADGRDVERSEFVAELHAQTPLGQFLLPADFGQLFTAIVVARYRYLDDRREAELPEEDPADHCHLARAVDEFERAAWFWPSVEAFFEDDHNPADGMAVSQDWLEGCRRGGKGFAAAAAATTITTTTDAAAPSSSVVGQDVATIAAGIDAMVLDGAEELGEEMDLDK